MRNATLPHRTMHSINVLGHVSSLGSVPDQQIDKRCARKALACSELAVCLPVIVLLVFGMIESCTMIFLQQSLTISAYEGARKAIGQDGSNSAVLVASEQVLQDRRIVGYQVAIAPADVSQVDPGEYITITVSASCDQNSCMNGWFYRNHQLQSQVVMMKEF